MRIEINLASEPFRQDRQMLAASAFVGMLLLATLTLLIVLAVRERQAAEAARIAVADVQTRSRALNAEEARLQAVLRQPQNAAVLERSLFLNSLIIPKAVSWTRIFSDLERVMPPNVRLMAIRPQVNAQTQTGKSDSPSSVTLDMTVGATTGDPVNAMLLALEGSPQFGATTVSSILPPSETDPLYRYRINVGYKQQ